MKAVRWTIVGLLGISVLVLAFAVGYVTRGDGRSNPTASTSQQEPGSTDFKTLNDIFKVLEARYVDPDIVDRDALYQAAINGMLRTFPDSGTYYVDSTTIRTSVGTSGKFEGIGATVGSQNGQIVIVAPIENTPAERAGLVSGDVILEVDGESTAGWSQEKAVLKIRGPRGSMVKLKVHHPEGGDATLDIERDEINVKSVTSQPPGGALEDASGAAIDDIAYIHIKEFDEPTKEEMDAALQDAVDSGKKGIVLDLRNNRGGLLHTTYEIADEFLDGGKLMLTERERDGSEQKFSSHAGGIATKLPVVIIMNRFSASGPEVLAAALHDNDRAQLVGEKSFGKGTVNLATQLKDGGELYVSVAKWLTPNGVQIEGAGLRPDIEVQLSDEDIDLRRDVQLYKALDVIRGTNFTPAPTPAAASPTPEATVTRTRG